MAKRRKRACPRLLPGRLFNDIELAGSVEAQAEGSLLVVFGAGAVGNGAASVFGAAACAAGAAAGASGAGGFWQKMQVLHFTVKTAQSHSWKWLWQQHREPQPQPLRNRKPSRGKWAWHNKREPERSKPVSHSMLLPAHSSHR